MYEPKFLGWRDEPDIITEEVDIQYFLGVKCRRCQREMVKYDWWRAQAKEYRKRVRHELTPEGARRICQPCYSHLLKYYPEVLDMYGTVHQKMSDFVEDYLIYKRRTDDRDQLAKLMGITRKAFDHKYYRAKRMELI